MVSHRLILLCWHFANHYFHVVLSFFNVILFVQEEYRVRQVMRGNHTHGGLMNTGHSSHVNVALQVRYHMFKTVEICGVCNGLLGYVYPCK